MSQRKQVNKFSPILTEPMSAKIARNYTLAIKKPTWHTIICVNTPLISIKMLFNGFSDRSVYYFRQEDKLSGVIRESFTMMRDSALKIKESGLKRIPWK
jgi:hypothetical protein